MKILFFYIVLIILSVNVYAQSKALDALKDSNKVYENERAKFDPKTNPEKDLQKAIKTAGSLNKRILLDVGGEWCIWCHRVDYFFLKNKDILNLLDDNFIVLKVNYSEDNKNEKFLSKYPKVAGYPHFFILDKDGKILHSQNTGDLEQGKGYSREKMLNFLNEWKIKSKS